MSRKYVAQVNNQNFVYPNQYMAEYDVEIIHNLNEASVYGTITNFSATTIASSAITLNFNWTWVSNGAEPFLGPYIYPGGYQMGFTIHCLPAGQTYYKPWRLADYVAVAVNTPSASGSHTTTIYPSQFQISSFTTGTYYFEFRMVGKRAVYPIGATLSITIP
jgi:hypothetical protein